jgi:hypothetical protein
MKQNNNNLGIILLIAAGAFARFIPHIPNFTPVEGLTIFGAAYLSRNYMAVLFPFIFIYMTDFIINNTIARAYFPEVNGIVWFSQYMIFNFLAILAIVFASRAILKVANARNVAISSILSSLIFYLVTNFGVWINPTSIFSKDFSGLMQTYIAGLPFLRTSIISTLFFSMILFGSYYLIGLILEHRKQASLN